MFYESHIRFNDAEKRRIAAIERFAPVLREPENAELLFAAAHETICDINANETDEDVYLGILRRAYSEGRNTLNRRQLLRLAQVLNQIANAFEHMADRQHEYQEVLGLLKEVIRPALDDMKMYDGLMDNLTRRVGNNDPLEI